LTAPAWTAILPASALHPRTVPKILVADDNPVSLRFFADALAGIGFEAECAGDGLAAVAAARRERFDLLLLDVNMPGLGGVDALRRIRAETGPSRDAVACATTAAGGDASRDALIAAGFGDVIAKPVSIDALRALLHRHMHAPMPTSDPDGAYGASPREDAILDDGAALAATGGDAAILAALRGLLMGELEALPNELEAMAARADLAALRDRLHRIDASAGFCGAPALVRAAARLRSVLDSGTGWPRDAAAEFLGACATVRDALASAGIAMAR
jgi:CheY-like chemotaxis protein/HPt (histidine-containing phosphotransfer) domain-containing protein